jgi:ribosome-binding factor A
MPSSIRLERIADRIRQNLSQMIIQRANDPRLSGVNVNEVRVDRELAYADIFVSVVEGKERSAEVLAGLNHASGFLRSQLAAQIDLRAFPRLRFHWDPTPEHADKIEKLLNEIKQTTDPEEDSSKNEK